MTCQHLTLSHGAWSLCKWIAILFLTKHSHVARRSLICLTKIVEQESTSGSPWHWKRCVKLVCCKQIFFNIIIIGKKRSPGWNGIHPVGHNPLKVWLNALENKCFECKVLTSCGCARFLHVFLLLSEAEAPWGFKILWEQHFEFISIPPSVHNHPHLPSPPSVFKHISTLLSPRKAKSCVAMATASLLETEMCDLGVTQPFSRLVETL